MRLGDQGLIVDYIVSKLRDKYPDMDSGEMVSWSSENTRYLIKYLKENMPEMLQMINISGYNIQVPNLFIDKDGSIREIKFSDLIQKDIESSVDTHKGSPYNDYPMYLVSIPVELGKSYKLLIKYDNSSSISVNFANPTKSWSLAPYSLYGITKGSYLNSDGVKIIVNKLLSNPSKQNKNYLRLSAEAFYIPFEQVIDILYTDTLTITKGTFYINGNEKTSSKDLLVVYDNKNKIASLKYKDGNQIFDTIKVGDEVTFTGTSKLELLRNDKNILTDEIKDIVLSIYKQVVGGIVINTTLRVAGTSKVEVGSTLTGLDLSVKLNSGLYRWYYDNAGNLSQSKDGRPFSGEVEVGPNDVLYMDGNPYITDGLTITQDIQGTVSDYEPYSITSLEINIDIEDSIATEISNKGGTLINEDENGYNLLIQLPKSTVNYSLVEVLKEEDGEYSSVIDPNEFADGSTITTDYLDIILLDRTITKYSDPDDIEYAQDLVTSYTGHEFKYKGVYDDDLRVLIKNIQSDPTKLPDPGDIDPGMMVGSLGLGRTHYITGWCDPETEIYLEMNYYGDRFE